MASREDVERVARLARIRLRSDEVESVRARFTKILEAFEVLREVNTNNVAPMFHAVGAMELRADEPEPALDRAKLLANAPESFDGSFSLPRVVGSEE